MVTQEPRLGDVVSIVGETDEGLIRARAVLLGQSAPDWYVGELEDGRQVEFRVDQIEGLEEPPYEMGGFLDWFRKKPAPPPESRSLIPVDQPAGVIYISPTGVAKYEEPKKPKKGLLKPITEAIKSFFTAPEGGSSIFDIFKTKTALIPEPEKEAIKYEKAASIFSQFIPPEKSLEPIAEKVASLIPPEGPTPLAPYVQKAEEIFEVIQPSAPIVPYEERQRRQMELWEGMFEESKEEEAISKAFEPVARPGESRYEPYPESVVMTPERAEVPESAGELQMEVKVLPTPPRTTLLPTPEEAARGFAGFFRSDLWDTLRTMSQEMRDDDMVMLKEPLETIGLCGGHPDPHEGIAIFLQIPWEEFRKRAVIEDIGGGEEEWVDIEQIREEIIFPAIDVINEALELVKPADVPGRLELNYSEDCGCLQIYYIDQSRELSEEEAEYYEYYGRLPSSGAQETEEGEPEEAPKPKKKKKAKKKKKVKR